MKLINILKSRGFSLMSHRDGFKIEGLRVIVWQTIDGWMAQGLEIDYAAGGTSVEDVMDRFVDGLAMTLHLNQKNYGTIEKVLKPAPVEYWQKFLTGKARPTSQPRYRDTLAAAIKKLSNVDLLPKHLSSLQLYQEAA